MKHCNHKHHLLGYLFCKFCEFLENLFGSDQCACGADKQQTGELIVTGMDEIDISLDFHPNHVIVKFTKPCTTTPCDTDYSDELSWEILTSDCGTQFSLHIEWEVSGARDITWKVCY